MLPTSRRTIKLIGTNLTRDFTSTPHDRSNKANTIATQSTHDSSKDKSKVPERLQYYKSLLEKSSSELIFPRSFADASSFSNYICKSDISPNLKLKNSLQIDSINRAVFTPTWDLLDRGGKAWRPLLGLIMANYFNLDTNSKSNKLLFDLLHLVELLHTASLIIDDVEDKSAMRRGGPCVHLKYGEDIAINAGISLLYFPVFKIIKDTADPLTKAKIAETYLEEMAAIHLGQAWDIEMKIRNRLPSLDDYVDTVICKTGVMPRLMVKLLKILVEEKRDAQFKILVDLVDSLSVAFQVRDDVLNITDSVLAKGKGFLGEDVYEGKLTLMVIHALTQGETQHRQRLESIITMKTKNEELIAEAIQIMTQVGSIDYANGVMNKHFNIVKQKCEELKSFTKSKDTDQNQREERNGVSSNSTNQTHLRDKELNLYAADDIFTLTEYLINRNV